MSREVLEVDALIVGGGPAGLAAACRLREIAKDLSIGVLEKSREVGAHVMSGAVLDPRSMDELVPRWRELGAPIEAEVEREEVCYLTGRSHYRLPVTPPSLRNDGCLVISLNRFVRWFGTIVEEQDVDFFPGFAGSELLIEKGQVVGVRTGDKGRGRDGTPKGNFEPGVDIRARVTILAEGARGSLTKTAIQTFNLDAARNPQVYSLGVKEVWEAGHPMIPGHVIHTMGFPLSSSEFGGGFLYGMQEGRVAVGLVVGLDYADPTLDPHERFQAFKTHPMVRGVLEGGQFVAYGARAIPEGGLWAIPECAFAGGLIIGDSAGFLNSMRLKGIHLAIKSGMLAGEVVADALASDDCSRSALAAFEDRVNESWIREELWPVRNFHQGFRRGIWAGMAHAALQLLTGGRGVRARYRNEPGHSRLRRLSTRGETGVRGSRRIKFDGTLTFDRLTDVDRSGTRHEEDQPCHLVVRDPAICHPTCTTEFGNPCQYFCPAAVYEMTPVQDELKLEINASNCVHCKTCDIMDPYQVIDWVPPEGGGGPDYRYL